MTSTKFITTQQAKEIIFNDGIVGMPTETVYGLAGAYNNPKSLHGIFQTKNRPLFDPLICHVHNSSMARELTQIWPEIAETLSSHFWPGPLTLILPKSEKVHDLITAGSSSVAIRCPNHPLALELIELCQVPLAAPSANKFGKTSPTTAQHVVEEFSQAISVIDGGTCQVGIESTILEISQTHDNTSCFQLTLHRPGMISKAQITEVLHRSHMNYQFVDKNQQKGPGALPFHYQPNRPVIFIHDGQFHQGEIIQILNQKKAIRLQEHQVQQLVLDRDPTIAARELYLKMRQLGSLDDLEYIYYQKETKNNKTENQQYQEQWQAIWERIEKSATYYLSPQQGLFKKS